MHSSGEQVGKTGEDVEQRTPEHPPPMDAVQHDLIVLNDEEIHESSDRDRTFFSSWVRLKVSMRSAMRR